MGDFTLQKLPSRRLQTLWEWKNRVLLEEYYIFNVATDAEAATTAIPRAGKAEECHHEYVCEGVVRITCFADKNNDRDNNHTNRSNQT